MFNNFQRENSLFDPNYFNQQHYQCHIAECAANLQRMYIHTCTYMAICTFSS